MKIKKHTLLSALFLFIFLSAFSSGAYVSIHNSIKEFSHSSFKKELKQDSKGSVSENLVFEENENDSEETLNSEFTIIPGLLNFDLVGLAVKTHFTEFSYSAKKISSIFLTIRVIRI